MESSIWINGLTSSLEIHEEEISNSVLALLINEVFTLAKVAVVLLPFRVTYRFTLGHNHVFPINL